MRVRVRMGKRIEEREERKLMGMGEKGGEERELINGDGWSGGGRERVFV